MPGWRKQEKTIHHYFQQQRCLMLCSRHRYHASVLSQRRWHRRFLSMGQFTAWASCAARQAQELHREAGVVESPCGLEELRQCQQAFSPQYQLLVMTRMKPFFIFKGPAAPHQIRLLKSNHHFDGCTSFPAFGDRSYYCVDCERGFNTDDGPTHTCQGKHYSECGRFDCGDYVRGTRPTD